MTAAAARLQMRPVVTPGCPYCGEDAELTDKGFVYARAHEGLVWICKPCRAWVPAHRNSPVHKPMGRLANGQLRALKVKANYFFDQLWRAASVMSGWDEHKARHAAYLWLAQEMGIEAGNCHIGNFNEVQTQVVIDICSAVGVKKEAA